MGAGPSVLAASNPKRRPFPIFRPFNQELLINWDISLINPDYIEVLNDRTTFRVLRPITLSFVARWQRTSKDAPIVLGLFLIINENYFNLAAPISLFNRILLSSEAGRAINLRAGTTFSLGFVTDFPGDPSLDLSSTIIESTSN